MNARTSLLLLAAAPGLALAACEYSYPTYERAPQLYSQRPGAAPQGLLPAIAARAEQLSGCRLHPLTLPLARRNAMLREGRLKLLLVATRSEVLDQTAEFVPLFLVPLRATVLAESRFNYADELLRSPQFRIGMLHGALFPPEVEQRLAPLRNSNRLEYSNDRNGLYLKLEHGRLDAVLETTSWLSGNQTADGLALRFIDFQPPMYVAVGGYLSRQLPAADRQRLQDALQQLVRSKEIEPLVLHYLPQLRGHLRRP